MSEADRTWRVTVDEQEYEIEVDHSVMTGKITVTLDGKEVGEDRMLARKKEIDFTVGSKSAVVGVTFAYAGFAAKSELHLDGRYVEPLAH